MKVTDLKKKLCEKSKEYDLANGNLYVLKNETKIYKGCSTPNCDGTGNTKPGKKTHSVDKNCPLVSLSFFKC